jgi:dGTP triphosphohydrolase
LGRFRHFEGNIVKIADIVAYINHTNDAIRSGLIKVNDLLEDVLRILEKPSERINTLIMICAMTGIEFAETTKNLK